MIIQVMIEVTYVKITHYIDKMKNDANKCCKRHAASPVFHAILDSTRLTPHLLTISGQDAAK